MANYGGISEDKVPEQLPMSSAHRDTLGLSSAASLCVDWLAHRNSVATKELASAVIAWVYRRAALFVVCEIP
jgi:hypothetical protein